MVNNTTETSTVPYSQILKQKLLSLDQYVQNFTKRYQKEESFRNLVENYLDINGFSKFKLKWGRKFNTKSYQHKTNELVREYAQKYYSDLEEAIKLEEEKEEAERCIAQLNQKRTVLSDITQKLEVKQEEVRQIEEEKSSKVQEVQQEFNAVSLTLEETVNKRIEEINFTTDSNRLAQELIKDKIQKSGMFKEDQYGNFTFNNEVMVLRMGEILLANTVKEIETEDKVSNFMSLSRNRYKQTLSHFAELESPDEIAEVDWVATQINAFSQGYKKPQLRHYVVPKYRSTPIKEKAVTTISHATAIDWSGSMTENNKSQIAKDSGLAGYTYMKKMNPNNPSFCCLWNGNRGIYEMPLHELYQMNNPDGGTPMHMAINWLIKVLSPLGPGIAHLYTDGFPDDIGAAKKAAKTFRDYPNLRLRIFLINPDYRSEGYIREIGTEAGPETRVSCIRVGDLAKTSLKDLYQTMGDLKRIENF